MKPLDLERFEKLEADRDWRLLGIEAIDQSFRAAFDRKQGSEYRKVAIESIAELKALRKWRETMLDARGGSFIEAAYSAAETELNDA